MHLRLRWSGWHVRPFALRLAIAALLVAATIFAPGREAQADDGQAGQSGNRSAKQRPPNVMVILVDDLGFSDLGCYGGEIATPAIDRLAADGLRFSQFYNTARCWPSRAALLTGYYAQQVRRDAIDGVAGARAGSGGGRPAWAPLLPEMLAPLGYRSYHSGKWHVDGRPLANGFSHSYEIGGGQNNYFSTAGITDDERPVPQTDDYYVTFGIAEHAVKCLQEHAREYADRPFFHYVCFTAPHFPLHAPQEYIDRYRARYQQGWDAIRRQRFERQQSEGIARGRLPALEREIGPPYHFPDALKILGAGEINRPLPWDELTPEQQTFQIEKMAIHAAMVHCIDEGVAAIVEGLKQTGAWDDTLILFASDNGASAEIMVRGGGHDPQAPAGSAATYLCLGPGWSSAANTPFRRHKTWVHEGGIATPLIAHWPRAIQDAGQWRHRPAHLVDIAPTLLELAGGSLPDEWNGRPTPPKPGISLAAELRRAGGAARGANEAKAAEQDGPTGPARAAPLWWLHEGNRAIRSGDWKLVAAKGDPWELYDLSVDRGETQNLAEQHPEKVQELAAAWERQAEEIRELLREENSQPEASKRAEAPQPRPTSSAPKANAPAKAPGSDSQSAPAAASSGDQPAAARGRLQFPGEQLTIAGRPAFLWLPPEEKRSQPQPWIFYAPTLPPYPDQAEAWMHEQFLAAGVAVAGVNVGEAYGSPASHKVFDALYDELVDRRGFAPRPCLFGRSRGGLWTSSWAIARPERAAGIIGIYPVYDFRTYPGLARAAPAYGMTADELAARPELNPVERLGELARAGVPVTIIHGDDDRVVPLQENSQELLRRYRAEGAESLVRLIVAPGQGHNYWPGFFREPALVEFAIERAKAGQAKPGRGAPTGAAKPD